MIKREQKIRMLKGVLSDRRKNITEIIIGKAFLIWYYLGIGIVLPFLDASLDKNEENYLTKTHFSTNLLLFLRYCTVKGREKRKSLFVCEGSLKVNPSSFKDMDSKVMIYKRVFFC